MACDNHRGSAGFSDHQTLVVVVVVVVAVVARALPVIMCDAEFNALSHDALKSN